MKTNGIMNGPAKAAFWLATGAASAALLLQ
jgi:2-keto-4-pentenoate hydratase